MSSLNKGIIENFFLKLKSLDWFIIALTNNNIYCKFSSTFKLRYRW